MSREADVRSSRVLDSGSNSSSAVSRSVTSEKFSSLMSLLAQAEHETEATTTTSSEQSNNNTSTTTSEAARRRTTRIAATRAPVTPQRESHTRPLSASALLSPRSLAASTGGADNNGAAKPAATRTSTAFPFSPSHTVTASSDARSRITVPESPNSSYSSETFSPLLSPPRSVRNAVAAAAAANATPTRADGQANAPSREKVVSNVSTTSNGTAVPASSNAARSTGAPVDTLRTKLASLKSELSRKDVTIEELRSKLSALELARASSESRLSSQLSSQQSEYEQLLASNQSFVEKVLADKADLNTQCETLGTKLQALEAEYKAKETAFRRDVLAAELAKAKEAWRATEKLARDKHLESHTKQIKAETLRALEPDIQKLLAKAAAQHQDAVAALEVRHAQNVADVRADHEQLVSTVRKQHAVEVEHAREEERVASQKKVRQTIEKYDKQMVEQRQRYQNELESARTRATTSSASLQNAIDQALLEQRKEHQFEVSQLKESHKQSLEDATRRAALREAAERERVEIEKETWSAMMHAKVARDCQEKERQSRTALQHQHAEEIELIIDKLSKENEKQCKEIVKEYEKKIDGLRRQASGDVSSSHRALEDLQSQHDSLARKFATVEEKYTATAARLESLQSQLSEKTHQVDSLEDAKRELEVKAATIQRETMQKFSTEKRQLRDQFQVMQSRLDDSVSQLASQSEASTRELSSALHARDREHAKQLDTMQTRVKDLLAKKERVIDALKQQVAEMQRDLHAQQRELIEQIDA